MSKYQTTVLEYIGKDLKKLGFLGLFKIKASKSRLPLWQIKDFNTLCAVPSVPCPDLGRADQWLTGAFWKYRLAFQCQAVTFKMGTQSCLSILPQLFNGNTFAWTFEMVSGLSTQPECHSPRSTL